MTRNAILHLFALLTTVVMAAGDLGAQRNQSDPATLRSRLERRFEVLPPRGGLALKPRDTSRGVQSIEVTNTLIAIDGEPATGPDLRQKLGIDDADLIRELS